MFFGKKKKYDLIFGLGEACSCSSTLRHADLQIRSYPFDWLFGSTFVGRVQILANNFENLIRFEDIVCTGNNGIPHHLCDIYTNKANGLGFNHDFLSGKDPAVEIIEVQKKYQRRADRLIQAAENAKTILAVWIDSPGAIWQKKNDADFIEGYKILQNRFPNAKIDLLFIEWAPEIPYKNRKFRKLSENIFKYSFDYQFHHKTKQIADFVVDEKLLFKVLKQYELNMSFKDKISNFLVKKAPFLKSFGIK
ncbi:MAG: papain-like cysteine peptidase [Candidatus Gastranaerophilales bacterium]|nr:papain-like cysteine peptidase [Candidatus Gastranaerophilales bacterium]